MGPADVQFRGWLGGWTVPLALEVLLEKRHLYQSILLEVEELKARLLADVPSMFRANYETSMESALKWSRWVPMPRGDVTKGDMGFPLQVRDDLLFFAPPDIKTYCETPKCGRIEAFNFRHAFNLLQDAPIASNAYDAPIHDYMRNAERFVSGKGLIQVFAFSYQCQSCKSTPQAFMVRREGPRVTLCGRAPIEHVETPKDIPDTVRKYYSGAVVAHQSGQTLAGLFLLRVLIEQWVRVFGNPRADDNLSAYMQSLPQDFKDHYPSLVMWYDKLSAAIHDADANVELFDEARTEIAEHFEARRIRKLPLPCAEQAQQTAK